MTLRTRLSRLEGAVRPSPQSIETWWTLDGERAAPPADIVVQVEAAAGDLRGQERWECAVWLPDDGLACLLGEAEDELQLVELG